MKDNYVLFGRFIPELFGYELGKNFNIEKLKEEMKLTK